MSQETTAASTISATFTSSASAIRFVMTPCHVGFQQVARLAGQAGSYSQDAVCINREGYGNLGVLG